jgi:hypothetical protein
MIHENPYKDYPDSPLQPTLSDEFMVAGWQLNFFRGEKDEVSSYTVNAGRVKNIRFVKKIQ